LLLAVALVGEKTTQQVVAAVAVLVDCLRDFLA